MDKTKLPIGVFDSGVGGISVLRELVKLMPEENFIFFGDSKNAPYGTKSLEEVRALSKKDADFLVEQGVKALVVACNTVTSAAVGILRETYADMPVIGIEPALKPAVLSKPHPRVLVMATPMTLREEKFHQLMLRYEDEADIVRLPCPGLVEFVERGELEGAALEKFLEGLFAPCRIESVDCAVLGCTHYPLVRPAIQKVLGSRVAIFDGGAGTARETRRRLLEAGLKNTAEKPGAVRMENSLGTAEMEALSWKLLGVKNLKEK
jgi:glutamate racemase